MEIIVNYFNYIIRIKLHFAKYDLLRKCYSVGLQSLSGTDKIHIFPLLFKRGVNIAVERYFHAAVSQKLRKCLYIKTQSDTGGGKYMTERMEMN